jgi:hypothetical protein
MDWYVALGPVLVLPLILLFAFVGCEQIVGVPDWTLDQSPAPVLLWYDALTLYELLAALNHTVATVDSAFTFRNANGPLPDVPGMQGQVSNPGMGKPPQWLSVPAVMTPADFYDAQGISVKCTVTVRVHAGTSLQPMPDVGSNFAEPFDGTMMATFWAEFSNPDRTNQTFTVTVTTTKPTNFQ